MERYKVIYYRTLIGEDEIEANTLSEVRQKAECKVSSMRDSDFDLVSKEAIEIEHNGVPICVTIVTSCWT